MRFTYYIFAEHVQIYKYIFTEHESVLTYHKLSDVVQKGFVQRDRLKNSFIL